MENEKRLIDANELIDEYEHFAYLEFIGKDFLDSLKDAPTVDAVEVVHAVWDDGYAIDRDGNIVYKSIDCSNCFEYFKIESHDREYWKERFKVCPFCGAKMDGDGNV